MNLKKGDILSNDVDIFLIYIEYFYSDDRIECTCFEIEENILIIQDGVVFDSKEDLLTYHFVNESLKKTFLKKLFLTDKISWE